MSTNTADVRGWTWVDSAQSENRAMTAVEASLKCLAMENLPASGVGVNVPLRRIPFPCAVMVLVFVQKTHGSHEQSQIGFSLMSEFNSTIPGRKPGGGKKISWSVATNSLPVSTKYMLIFRKRHVCGYFANVSMFWCDRLKGIEASFLHQACWATWMDRPNGLLFI